ncbi:MAG: PD-(D/E)XK nuclease family protein [Candidatus Coatesbacteria bacterium]|nr:PD-(D/E)XK nuclease family protein [Candidatus Coatesbacteria bacterium]
MTRLAIHRGPVGPAKTRRFRDELKRRLGQDKADTLLYLVPSLSFARQIEKEMLDRLPGFFSAPLTTFGPLFKDLYTALRENRRLLSEAARDALIVGLVKNARDEGLLSTLGESAYSLGISRTLGRLFATFGRHSLISPESVRVAVGEQFARGASKLNHALVLYDRYRAALERNSFIDAEHAGVLVCEALSRGHEGLAKRLRGLELMLVEGFFSFSPLEERLLLSLIKALPESWVSLDLDPDGSDEVFALPRRTLAALESLADSVDIESRLFPAQRDLDRTRLRIANTIYSDHVPEALSESNDRAECHGEQPPDVHIVEAPDPRRELRGMARAVKRLIMDGKCKPEDIVVSFPQFAERERDVRRMLEEYGIPVAGPETLPVLQSAAVQAFSSLLDMVQEGFRRDDVLDFLRCPFLWPEGLLERAKDTPPERIDPEYIDAHTRQGKMLGGGAAAIESYRAGFAARRRQIAESQPRGNKADGKGEKLEFFDQQTGALLQILERLKASIGASSSPCDFSDACLRLLSQLELGQRLVSTLGQSGGTDGARAEFKALSRLKETLEDVSTGLAAGGVSEAPLGFFRLAVLSALRGERLKTVAGSDGLRLLPMKEAWLWPCDYLFCCGLTEAAFPGPVRGDVFLSKEARARLGLAPLDESVMESKFLIHALLLRPNKGLFLSYSTSVDEKPALGAACLQEIEMVAAVAPVRWQALDAGSDVPCSIDELQSALGCWVRNTGATVPDELLRQSVAFAAHGDERPGGRCVTPRGVIRRLVSSLERACVGSRFDGNLSTPLAAHVRSLLADEELSKSHRQPVFHLSPSALQDYIECPFRFFARRILRLQPEEEFDPDVQPKDLGTLIHRVLYLFYDGRRGEVGSISPVTRANMGDARSQLFEIARRQVDRDMPAGFSRRRVSSLLLEPGRLLDAFVENEAAEQERWRPLALETSFGRGKVVKRAAECLSPKPLVLRCEVDGRTEIAAIDGIIDRVDVKTEGHRTVYRVLDYKTGSIPEPKEIREGTSLQLPIYVAAIQQILGCDAVAGYYVLSETKEIKIKDYTRQRTLETAVENLPDVVANILRGIIACDFSPRPLDDNMRLCSYCDFSAACRRAQGGSDGV